MFVFVFAKKLTRLTFVLSCCQDCGIAESPQYGHQSAKKKLALSTGDSINEGFFLQENV